MAKPRFEIDCLAVGHNQMRFEEYADAIRSTGERSGAHRDIRLSYYQENGQIITCRDFCNRQLENGVSYDDILSATITTLGSFLEKHGLTFDYINSFQEGRGRLEQLLLQGKITSIAITTTYYVSPYPLLEILGFIRKIDPRVPIIVGGPFIHTQSKLHDAGAFDFLLRQVGADYYVVSDQGETTLVRLLKAIRSGESIADIPNVISRDGRAYRHNVLEQEDNEIADNPTQWGLFAPERQDRPRRMVMKWTAKSCPFSCSFCSFPEHAGTYRYAQPEQVWKELDAIEALGQINSVTFIDDTFNIPPHRFRDLIRGMTERQYSFRWNCNFRCQYATEEIVAAMKEAGCEGVFLGIESGSDTILRNMNKHATVEQYRQGVSLLKGAGIVTHASFIVGFPGETASSVQETAAFIEETGPDFFRTQLWYYDTLTPIHRSADRYGLRNSQFAWSHDTMDADEAADWIDFLHASIGNSIWLPQNDFDFPAIFCLLSRGWTINQIKRSLRAFNEEVSTRLWARNGAPIRPLVRERGWASGPDFNFESVMRDG
jgi:anaerobic magnesium-protoporphyrin IX monomethyl ester cyclase